MKHKIALYFSSFVLFGLLFAAANATAQTIAYRQANLSSNLPNVARLGQSLGDCISSRTAILHR